MRKRFFRIVATAVLAFACTACGKKSEAPSGGASPEMNVREADRAPADDNLLLEDDAVQIVLEKVPGATKKNVRMKLEQDDGRQIYEGSVIYEETEYEFEIDAADGMILEWEENSIYD